MAADEKQRAGVVLQPEVIAVGGAAALAGVALLGVFLWMVPNAAANEAAAACRGMRGEEVLNPALCPNGSSCTAPIPAPDFTATDINGKPVKLSDYRGKVVLLN